MRLIVGISYYKAGVACQENRPPGDNMSAPGTNRRILMVLILLAAGGCATTTTNETSSVPTMAAAESAADESDHVRLSPTELATRARQAVVTINGYRNGEVLQSGTGFFIREDGVLVTNLHVVAGAERLTVELPDGEIFDAVYVLAKDVRRDLILLQIPVAHAAVLPVTQQRDIRVGEHVYAIGNPLGLRGTFSDGLVSGRRVEDGVTYLQITAPISQGSSGGPVISEEGDVIGVATSFYTDGQNLNMATPAWHAIGMLVIAGEPRRFESVSGELKTEEQRLVEARADETRQIMEVLPSEMRASLQGLGEYEQQVAARALVVSALMVDDGWTYLDGVGGSGTLEADELDGVHATLERGRYLVAAVCDDDCTDLDLIVMDSAGQAVGVDTELDPEPVVTFDVQYRQEYGVAVKMVECAATDCVYSIQIFRED